MKMLKIPIGIVTIWHPDRLWKIKPRELFDLPSIKKDRKKQEYHKVQLSEQKKLKTTTEILHGRPIVNFGDPKYSFRKTWLDGKDILGVLSDYSIRLIKTEREGTQAPFRAEARPNWGTEPNILPDKLISNMHSFLLMDKISVRQLWVNPFTRALPNSSLGPFNDANATINLVIGPFDKKECFRKAKIHFIKHKQSVSIHQHSPRYKSVSSNDPIKILSGCSFWWAKYE